MTLDTALRPAPPTRPARLADIDAMHRVRVAVRENRLSRPDRIRAEDYVAALTRDGRGWVAESDGALVAFAVGLASGNIWALFVDPAHEGRGYGRALHDVMVDWLWSQGLQRLWLSTDPHTRAERFYLARGWRSVGPTPDGEVRLELERAWLPLPSSSCA